MKHEIFDVDGRHAVDQKRLKRIVESWSMDPIDFLDETIAVAGRGERRDTGTWVVLGNTRVSAARGYGPSIEPGWRRWALLSADGTVHARHDWDAPWVTRGPSGALFWCFGRHQVRVDLAGLLARCSAHAERVGALQ